MLKALLATLVRNVAGTRRARRGARAFEDAHRLLGEGDTVRAKARLIEALELDRALAPAHERLGLLYTAELKYDEALEHFRAAHALAPLGGGALRTCVQVLLQRGKLEDAERVAGQAAAASPASAEAWFALALVHQAQQRHRDALAGCDRALEAGADDADIHTQRAIALQHLGHLAEAYAGYDRALARRPGYALARFHRSLALLASGDYARGWTDYELRLASADLQARPRQYPRWSGEALEGHSVLVYGEQGLGDEIMFASCLPDLLATGARCIVECHPALEKLFARSFPQTDVYAATPDKRLPECVHAARVDYEVPAGSLPLYLRSSPEAFPAHSGYLRADPARVAFWRARLDALGPGPKVGLSWRGGTHATRTAFRSIALDAWVPLLATPGIDFVSLQYTPEAGAEVQAWSRERGVALTHWADALGDYDETAALVTALDLVVTVCTSLVHLAGALGVPVWVLAPRNPEWRYGRTGAQMPWYPSARVYRQEIEGVWAPTIEAVRGALTAPATWSRAGLRQLSRSDPRSAQTCFERALALAPRLGEAHNNLDIAFVEQGEFAQGERHLREAIALEPALVAARANLATLLTKSFAHDAAVQAWNDVLKLDPEHADAHAHKAYLAMREGDFSASREMRRRALELGAERAPLLMQEASMLALEGETEAADALLATLEGSAEPGSLAWERGIAALSAGRFAEGWPLYEVRLARAFESPRRPYAFPEWDATPPGAGRALLVMGEQGLGDEIMFASCYGDAAARAGRCVIECEPRLAPLFARSFPQAEVVGQARSGAHAAIVGRSDIACQVHAGSLPLYFRRTLEAFPQHAGYLRADPARVEYWRARLQRAGPAHWVGVSWNGGLKHTHRPLRSMPVQTFAGMLQERRIGYVSLQHDDDGTDAAAISSAAGVPLHVFDGVLDDLDETAALMSALDAVLSVCSTVVHLAGALGRPTLVLTPAWPEWRYLRAGSRLPWYPTARVLRQARIGAWDPVVEEASAALLRLARDGVFDQPINVPGQPVGETP